jgi:hypothetical protein
MRRRFPFFALVLSYGLAVMLLAVPRAAAEEAAQLPERFSGTVVLADQPKSGTARIAVTIERWSTVEERKAAKEALRAGGVNALIDAMRKSEVGYLQINDSLGWRLRLASTFQNERGRIVRVATDRPIGIQEGWRTSSSLDYPVGVVEFILPPEGDATGTLLMATKVRFDDQGNVEIQSLPANTGPSQIIGVRREVLKRKPKTAEK